MGESEKPAQASSSSSSSASSAAVPSPAPAFMEDESFDKAIAACSEVGAAASSKVEPRLRACDDPSLACPKPSKADWKAEVKQIRAIVEDSSIADEEKIRILHEALQQRIEDTKCTDEVKALALKRCESVKAEKERLASEVQRTATLKVKLEACCREQKEQMNSLSKENARIAEEERHRHVELKEKFQQAINDVQEKMDAELEVRQHFLKENDDLRGKLQKFNETYEAQEAQLAEQRDAREKEMQAAQTRLVEHEAMCSSSKKNSTELEKDNEVRKKSQAHLQNELQAILAKFDDFSKSVSGSNQKHSECKEEIDLLQTHMEDLEKENADLKTSAKIAELTSEAGVIRKQRDALEKLCDNLHKENKKVQQQLNELRNKK